MKRASIGTKRKSNSGTQDPLQCMQCDKVHRCLAELRSHMRKHNGNLVNLNETLLLTIFEEQCTPSSAINASDRLTRISEFAITTESIRTCAIVGRKRFARRTELIQHRDTKHAETRFICAECGKAFSDNGTLNDHLRLNPFKCACGDDFNTNAELFHHRMVEHGH